MSASPSPDVGKAPTDPAPASRPSVVPACSDCAVVLVEGGFRKASGGVIGLGTSCAVHPTGNAPQGTSLIDESPRDVELLRALTRAAHLARHVSGHEPFLIRPNPADLEAEAAEDQGHRAELERMHERNALHKTALALLTAWSHGDGTKADALGVENAVIVARQLRAAIQKE
jgi:hypothetical protein